MNLDELQSVQARERQSSDLQHLRSSFYQEVGEFINDLDEKRARAVEEADDPFSEPEVRRLTDDIETAEGTIEAIYERRVGKVVKKASIAAAGMPVEDDGLTNEEEALFEDLVGRIESNRETVLSVLDGEAPTVSCSIDEQDTEANDTGSGSAMEERTIDADPDPTPARGDGVSAADLMGDSTTAASEPTSVDDETSTTASTETDSTTAADTGLNRPESPVQADGTARNDDRDPLGTNNTGPETTPERDIPGLPRTTVRITADVGEIVGADDRDYDLSSEDVVTLPDPNADVLVEKDAAERLQ